MSFACTSWAYSSLLVLTLTTMAFRTGAQTAPTRQECLDTYLAGINAAQASGDYNAYQGLAADYTSCLGQVYGGSSVPTPPAPAAPVTVRASRPVVPVPVSAPGPAPCPAPATATVGATSAPTVPNSPSPAGPMSPTARQNYNNAYQTALSNAMAAGDQTAVQNLHAAYNQAMGTGR